MSELQELIPMTLDEFESMIKDERLCYELVDGIVAMSPSPSFQHQVLGSRLVSIASNQLKSVCTAVYEFDIKIDKYNMRYDDWHCVRSYGNARACFQRRSVIEQKRDRYNHRKLRGYV